IEVLTSMNATLIAKMFHMNDPDARGVVSIDTFTTMLPSDDPFKPQLQELSRQFKFASADKIVADAELVEVERDEFEEKDDQLLKPQNGGGPTLKKGLANTGAKRGRKPKSFTAVTAKKSAAVTKQTASTSGPKRKRRKKLVSKGAASSSKGIGMD